MVPPEAQPIVLEADDEPVSVRGLAPNPEILARVDAALAAAPRVLIEALEQAERLDRPAQERDRR
jgi:hypothetical protein